MTRRALLALVIALVAAPTASEAAASNSPYVVLPSIGHTSSVQAIALSRDGKLTVSASADKSVKVWDNATGKLLRTFSDHRDEVTSVVFLPDGVTVISAGGGVGAEGDNSIRIWDARTGQIFRTLIGHMAKITSLALAVDGKTALTSSLDGTYKVWDVETGAVRRTFPWSKGGSLGLLFPDGRRMVLDRDTGVDIVEVASGRVLRTLNADKKIVLALAISPDGNFVFAGTSNKRVVRWNVATGQLDRTFTTNAAPHALALSDDGSRLAVGTGYDRFNDFDSPSLDAVTIMDAESGVVSRSFAHQHDWINALIIAQRNTEVFVANQSGAVERWNIGDATVTSYGGAFETPSLTVSQSGKRLASSSGRYVTVWDLENGTLVARYEQPRSLQCTSLSPDGDSILVGSFGNRDASRRQWGDYDLKLLSANTGKVLHTVFAGQPTFPPCPIVFLPDSRRFISTYTIQKPNGRNTESVLWDADADVPSPIFGSTPAGFALGPDGKTALAADEQSLKVFDVDSARQIRRLALGSYIPNRRIDFGALSPDARQIAWLGQNDKGLYPIKLSDAETGNFIRTVAAQTASFNSLAFSPDGRWLLTGGNDRLVKLWDVQSGALLRVFEGHSAAVRTAVFTSDATRIISAGEDATIRIWNVADGLLIATLTNSADGSWLVMIPEGFFAGSDTTRSSIAVVRGLEVFAIDQFFQTLYRPDLVREKLAGDPRGLVREAAAQVTLDRALESGYAPAVRLTTSGSTPLVQNQITVIAEITELGGGIGRVEWRVNGVTQGIDNAIPNGSASLRLSRELPLDNGDNRIDVVAYNSANLIASIPARLDAPTAANAPPAPPASGPSGAEPAQPQTSAASRLFVLAAGSDGYADKRFRLQYSVADANAVSQAFSLAGQSIFSSVQVRVLRDSEVVTEKLDATFADLAKTIQPTDTLIVYLAGHGKTVDGRYYFVPQNFHVGENLSEEMINQAVRQQGIAQEQWQKWFALIPARRSVIMFDTCESGTLAGDAGETKALERGAANDRMAQATGRSIITASSGTQEAFEGYQGHGLFTYNVLDALDRGDGDDNGTIDVTELGAFVYAETKAISERVFKQRQEPQIKLVGNYAVARRTRVLKEIEPVVATTYQPTFQVAETAPLQVGPTNDSTVVRNLTPKTMLEVLKVEGSWSLVAQRGRPLGYVPTRHLTPLQ